jgi:hypothetical protein
MYNWVFALVIALLLWVIVKWLFIRPAENKFDKLARECMDRQALKRHGTLTVAERMPALTIPYKTTTIDLGYITNNDDLSREFTYARFRTEHFPDKKFSMYVNSKDFFVKPLAIGTRVEIVDERLREKYVVTGNDAAFVNRLLNEEVRAKLLQESLHVKFGRRIDSSSLSRERGWLTVFTQGTQAENKLFDGLIETAILFYETLESLSNRSE